MVCVSRLSIYAIGGIAVTALFNVPMNEALALVNITGSTEAAAIVWRDYSQSWQGWNQVRTVASGAVVLLTGIGLVRIR